MTTRITANVGTGTVRQSLWGRPQHPRPLLAFACHALAVVALSALGTAASLADTVRHDVRIDAKPVNAAVKELAAQTGLQLIVLSEDAADKRSAAVQGNLTNEEALAQLLRDTGLTYEKIDDNTVAIKSRNVPTAAATIAGSANLHLAQNAEVQAPVDTTQPQQDAAQGSDSQGADTLEEIVVTAQKREEKMRDVPASISVLTGDQIERTGATGLAEYASYVPGLAVNSGGAPGKTSIILRGISTGPGDPLVGTYLDETPLGASSGFARAGTYALDLLPYDLERLEVLRGPQGTLYGAGAMGGLVKYVLRPANPNETEVRFGTVLESTDSTDTPTYGARGMVNTPIIDGVLAVRASGFYQKNAGWIDNASTGIRNQNDSTQKGGRLALFWQPSDAIKVKASMLLQDVEADGNAVVTLDGATLRPVFGKYSRGNLLPEPYEQKLRYYALTADWDAGFATLTSATSWSHSQNKSFVDESGIYSALVAAIPDLAALGTLDLSDFLLDVSLDKFTQEFRLASPAGDRFEWLAGAYYTDEDVVNIQALGAYDSAGVPVPGLTPFATVFWPTTYREYSAFGDITYKFTSSFDITAGVRYSHNKQDYLQDLDGVLFGGPVQLRAESQDDVTTYSLSSRYRPTANATFYGRIASGYRAGGPNVPLPGVPEKYDPDRLINYEVGYKATLLDSALDFDLALFYIDWTDIQITVVEPTGSFPGNGSKASSKGAEATARYRLTHNLNVGVNASYTDAHLDEPVESLGGLAGDQLPGAPSWTAAITADYSAPLSNGSIFDTGVAYRYRGSSLTSVESNSATLRIPAQKSIVDAFAALTWGSVTTRLYARNLFNERTYTTFFDPDAGVSANFVPVQPRTVGLSVDLRF